ncbi:MAG: MaoC family dehydratase [Chloroflexi bacterium]|nr:MaoC family dehydratase [Chloroflexota bacterium]
MKHWPGRTISEADNTWFSLLTQNQNPLHIDSNYAEKHTQHARPLVVGTLVFAIAVGQTVADVSGRAIANLEYERVTHDGPVFAGDTIYTSSTILETKLSSRGDRGVVYLETVATNQRGEKVLTLRRRVLIPTRAHATLGEGKLP